METNIHSNETDFTFQGKSRKQVKDSEDFGVLTLEVFAVFAVIVIAVNLIEKAIKLIW